MPKRKAKQQGGKLNLKATLPMVKPIGRKLYHSFKPYLKETAQAGIAGLGASASVFQPELAPFILPASLGLSALAGEIIDDPSLFISKKNENNIYQIKYQINFITNNHLLLNRLFHQIMFINHQ